MSLGRGTQYVFGKRHPICLWEETPSRSLGRGTQYVFGKRDLVYRWEEAPTCPRSSDALTEYEGNKSSGNDDDSYDSGSGRRTERATHDALTWWNSHVKTIGHDAAYEMPWKTLMKMMTAKRMFPEESNEVEKYVGGLPDMIQGSVMASKPKTMQDAIDDNNAQQLPFKRQNVARAYSAGPREKKEYAGTLPLCNKSPTTIANNQRTLTCYECKKQGHYRSDCPELKNRNYGNQAGGTETRGMVYALGGEETDQDPQQHGR
ncbi:putative reverse transcriptase domain-containing protein [Tanacetum coccineum]